MILSRFHASISEAGFDPDALDDNFDLLTSGVIDSIGLVELIAAIEQQFGITLDLADMDPENLTVLGPLCKYIEAHTSITSSDRSSHELSGGRAT